MTIQTTEFETAKKIKDLGLKREGHFWYNKNGELFSERMVFSNWDKPISSKKLNIPDPINIDDGHGNTIPYAEYKKKNPSDCKLDISYVFAHQLTDKEREEQLAQYTAAYTLDEIVGMLPPEIVTNHDPYESYCFYMNYDCELEFETRYTENGGLKNLITFVHKNPAEAAAQLLIWCIDKGYLKVEELNK
jgi:hypothetical protein